ncbi:5-oxoprolinase [Malassezia pachydermatis]
MFSYTYPEHEQMVKAWAKEIGFPSISCSAELMPMIKMVPRATSATADAYLTPVLQAYIDSFFSGFDSSLRDGSAGTRVEFMMSDGGLTSVDHFTGLKSIISGPAGGVVGMALTTYDANDRRPVIGFDMGGTSTDVSRYAGRYEQIMETTIDGVTIQSPQLEYVPSCLTTVSIRWRPVALRVCSSATACLWSALKVRRPTQAQRVIAKAVHWPLQTRTS